MTALSLKNVYKSFGAVEVLKDINIEVEEGEFVVFVGPSGCGKSTLLRIIAGLEDASSGEVNIGGNVVNTTPPSKRGIAMVFQSYALYPHLNVRGNMSLALKQEGHSKAEITSRITEASRMRNLKTISTGIHQNSPAASVSVWPSGGRLSASRSCSCLMNRCRTLMLHSG